MPVLLQILSGAKRAQDLMPKGSVIALPKNAVIELVIPPGGAVGGPHPFHLHGVSDKCSQNNVDAYRGRTRM